MKRLFFINIIIMISVFQVIYSAPDSRNIFNQGVEAFKAGNYASAELLFRKTEENNDEYRDRAWYYLSRTIFQQGKYKAAIFEFNSFLTKCRTESLRIESRFWIGESYYNLNENLKAIEEYTRFLEKTEDSALIIIAYDRLASIYFKQQRFEEAIIQWENAIQSSTDREFNAGIVLKIGHALFMNNKYEEALARLNPLLSARIDLKKKSEIRLLIGRIYQIQKDHKKALTTFNAIPSDYAEMYPFHDMYYFRALSYLETDRINLAKSDLELFYIIGKKSEFYPDGMYELGKIILNSSKPEPGLEILEKVWEAQEKLDLSVQSALLMAEYFIEKEPAKSIKYLEKFKTYDNEELKKAIIITISKAYIKNENFADAETILQQFIEKYPYDQNIDEAKFLQARILLEKGDVDKATSIFIELKKNNPFSKYLNDSHYYLALVSYKKGKINDSISYLKKYVSLKKINYSFDAHRLLAELYIKTADIKNSEKIINILINQYMNNSGVDKLVYQFALLLDEKSNRNSTKYFTLLQHRFPDSDYSMMVNIIYGNKYFKNKNYSKAIIYYEKILNTNIEESRGVVYYNLLQSYYYLKDYVKVITIIRNIKIPPLDEEQWKQIPLLHARSLYKTGRFDGVYNVLKWEDIKTFNNDDASILIESTLKTGDIEAAIKFINRLKDRNGFFQDQLFKIGNYYKEKKNYLKAEEVFNSIILSSRNEIIKENALIKLAIIKMENADYNQSLNYLNRIVLKNNFSERDSLIIINNFLAGNEEKASDLSDSKINYLTDSRFTERVLLLNFDYNYKKKNIESFNRYTQLLKPFTKNSNYINFYSGKLFYDTGDYKKSFNHFYKLSLKQNEYSDETNYYLGKLSLLYNKNKNNALKYFIKTAESESATMDLFSKSRIELALIYFEMKNSDNALNYLNDILKENTNNKYKIEAENLIEYFKE